MAASEKRGSDIGINLKLENINNLEEKEGTIAALYGESVFH